MKKIEHINPFNTFFYRDCYYNSLFSILQFYGLNIFIVLANEVFFYSGQENKILGGTAKYRQVVPIDKLLKRMNVQCSFENSIHGLMERIVESLDQDSPVILLVDCYEEEIRKDLYHKEHLDHSLLIYGYDEQTEEFIVMEQGKKNTLDYQEKRISFQSTYDSVKSYQELYGEEKADEPLLTCFSYSEESPYAHKTQDSGVQYAENYLLAVPMLKKQDEALVKIRERLCYYFDQDVIAQSSVDEILETLNCIINGHLVEQKKITEFFKDKELTMLEERVLGHWQFIRLTVLNYKFQGNNLKEKTNEAKKRIELMVSDVKRLNELVFFYCKKLRENGGDIFGI